MAKRRKIGEEFEIPYGQRMHLDNANVERELADYLYIRAIEHHKEYLQKKNLFWRQITQENNIPKNSTMRISNNGWKIKVIKLSDQHTDELRRNELERKTLELEIIRLKRKLKEP